MKKKIKKLTILLLIICIFVSLFNIGKVLAEEPSFILSDANIIDKSDGVEASISSYDGETLDIDSIFHKIEDFANYKLTIKNNTTKNDKSQQKIHKYTDCHFSQFIILFKNNNI